MSRRRCSRLSLAAILPAAALVAGCAGADADDAGDGWRPCSSETFDVTAGAVASTFELDVSSLAPANVERAAVCRYGEQATDEMTLSADQVGELHDTLARAGDLSPDCPPEATAANEVLIVVVDLENRRDDAQFNVATSDRRCESVVLGGGQLAADDLGDLVRGWFA